MFIASPKSIAYTLWLDIDIALLETDKKSPKLSQFTKPGCNNRFSKAWKVSIPGYCGGIYCQSEE